MHSTGSKGVVWLVAVICACALLYLFRLSMTRGGSPEVRGNALRYPLRPGMRWLSCILILLSAACLAGSVRAYFRHQPAACVTYGAFGLLLAPGGAFILSCHFALDEVGLHYRRWPARETTMLWDDIDHYEVMINRKAASSVYFFRSKAGKTLAVTDTAYDIDDLLRRINAKIPLRKEPYKPAHWYGG